MEDASGSGSGSGQAGVVPPLPPPCPKSPPPYPDVHGRRREMIRIQLLEREKTFLQEELKFVEGLQPASICCKEVVDFVTANGDPLITKNQKISKCRHFWKWLCGPCLSCFNCSWMCCCSGCSINLKPPNCNCCTLPNCCRIPDCCSCSCPKIRCSLPKSRCCHNPLSCCCTDNPCSCLNSSCCSLKPLKFLLCSECCSCSCKCTCSCSECVAGPECACPKCSCHNCCSCAKCSAQCGCFSCIKDCCCHTCRCICC